MSPYFLEYLISQVKLHVSEVATDIAACAHDMDTRNPHGC